MADPFNRAVGRFVRTDLKRDAQGPYYDVQVSGGGGAAPVRQGNEDASPTVLDPDLDYGPPLPPGSVPYGDEEGPIPDEDMMPDDADDESARAMLPGPMLAQNDDPAFLQRVMNWIRSRGADIQPASRDVAEGINEALPEGVSGRDAVKKKREQLRRMDEQTQES